MRSLLIAATVAVAGLSASSASAQWWGYSQYGSPYRYNVDDRYQRAVYQVRQQCDQALRYARSQRQYNETARRCDRRLRQLEAEYRQQLRNDHRYWSDRNWRGRDMDDDWDDDDD